MNRMCAKSTSAASNCLLWCLVERYAALVEVEKRDTVRRSHFKVCRRPDDCKDCLFFLRTATTAQWLASRAQAFSLPNLGSRRCRLHHCNATGTRLWGVNVLLYLISDNLECLCIMGMHGMSMLTPKLHETSLFLQFSPVLYGCISGVATPTLPHILSMSDEMTNDAPPPRSREMREKGRPGLQICRDADVPSLPHNQRCIWKIHGFQALLFCLPCTASSAIAPLTTAAKRHVATAFRTAQLLCSPGITHWGCRFDRPVRSLGL